MIDYSPQAQKAKLDAHIRRELYKQDVERMKRGPYYANGCLRIPSYFFNETAAAEWKRRGLRYDGDRREWFIAVPAQFADEQLRKARVVFDGVWHIQREQQPC